MSVIHWGQVIAQGTLTDIGVGDPWASSGAGYGLLTRAVRYTSRMFDVTATVLEPASL